MNESKDKEDFFIGVDIGTTNIRACLFDSNFKVLYFANERVKLIINSDEEVVEVDPDDLLFQLRVVVSKVVEKVADLNAIVSIGLSCQRNTFISWDIETKKPCHSLITWKDGRGKMACYKHNKSCWLKLLNLSGSIGYCITGIERFKSAKILKFINAMVTHRFLVTLHRSEEMKKLLEQNRLAVGCIDTWLLYRLTNGRVFITDPSAISSTGLYDPFLRDYGRSLLRMIGLPPNVLLPEIMDTTAINAKIDTEFFGERPLRIRAAAGDAQSAAFGAGCLRNGSLSVCMGTGVFYDAVMGDEPRSTASVDSGLFPLVGWRINGNYKFLIEGHANCSANLVDWAHRVGLLDVIADASDIALSAEAGESPYYIPGLEDIQAPKSDDIFACGGMLCLRTCTSNAQIVRALLEAIVFGVAQIHERCQVDFPDFKPKAIRVSGGVSSNDFICQQLANLTNLSIERVSDNHFCASRGAAFLAAIATGKITMTDVQKFVTIERVFVPEDEKQRNVTLETFEKWKNAQKRCQSFYK